MIRNLAVITTIFIFLFAFGCEGLTKGKNLDNLSLKEKCKYYEEENAKLMSQKPDYEIEKAEEN